MNSTDFLQANGVLVNNASDVKVGDIVGHANDQHTVRLYYVKMVDLHTTPPCIPPPVPRVYFKAPHIGITPKHRECRHYIYTPMPGEDYQCSWGDYSGMNLEKLKAESIKDYYALCAEEIFDMYLITNDQYKKLGSLIPEVEVPSWGFLCQTTNGTQSIYDFVESVKEDLKKAKEIHAKIKARAERVQ